MTHPRTLPDGLTTYGKSLAFTHETVPQGLLRDHDLASERWGLLRVLEGSVRFHDLVKDKTFSLQAPDQIVISPRALHKLILDGPMRCHLEFYRPAQ